ncbi:hypothetical protein BC829DRAFT_381972 [Chytridium lagenaria]|nr:hypothetical protein BC829DRAFT_381972 [Chytridium lagenaria]
MYPSKGAGKKSRDASDRPFLEPSLASTSMTRPLISNRGGGLTAYATGSILLYGNSADMTKAPPSSVGSGERTLDSDNLEYVPILLRKATGRVREVKGGPRYLDPTRNTLIPILSLVNPEPSVEIAFEQCVVAQLGDPTTIPLGDSRQGHMGLELTCLPLRTYSAYERPDAIGLGSSAASRISTLSDAASISASSRISLDGSALTDETKRRGSLKAGQISLDGFDMIDGVTFRAAYQHVPMLPDEVELRYGDIIKVS